MFFFSGAADTALRIFSNREVFLRDLLLILILHGVKKIDAIADGTSGTMRWLIQ